MSCELINLETGKMYMRTKAGIHVLSPPMMASSKLFCVSHELCKRLWHPFYGILFFSSLTNVEEVRKNTKKWGKKSPLVSFSPLSSLCSITFHVGKVRFGCGTCERRMVAADLGEGEGHCDICKELTEADRERMLALLLGSLTLINEREWHTERGAKLRREGWHWYSSLI